MLTTLIKTIFNIVGNFFRNLFRNFFRNFFWKIVSVIVAVTLWFVVINIKNPVRMQQESVTLDVRNEDALTQHGYALLNPAAVYDRKVYFSVNAPLKDLSDFKTANVVAFIDFNELDFTQVNGISKPVALTVHYNTVYLPNTGAYKIDPVTMTVSVSLDNYVERPFAIKLDTKGSPAAGYIRTGIDFSPKTVNISGPQSVLDGITAVTAAIDLSGAKNDVVTTSPIVVNSKEGPTADRITLSEQTCSVTADINKTGEAAIAPPQSAGTPAEDYVLTGLDISADSVSIYGKAADLSKLKPIAIDPVDITGLTATKQFFIDLKPYLAAQNVSPLHSDQSGVTVTANIAQLQSRYIQYPTSFIATDAPSGAYTISPDSVQLLVKGTPAALDALNIRDITARISGVGSLGPGSHVISVGFTAPADITILNNPTSITLTVPQPQVSTETSAGQGEQIAQAGQADQFAQAGQTDQISQAGQADQTAPAEQAPPAQAYVPPSQGADQLEQNP